MSSRLDSRRLRSTKQSTQAGSRRKVAQRLATRRLLLEVLEQRTVLDEALGDILVNQGQTALDPSDYDPSTILVRFKPGAAAHEAAPGTALGRKFDLVPGLRSVHLSKGKSVEAALQAYRSNPNVIYAEPNGLVQASLAPNDPRYVDGSLYGMTKISAPAAWDITTGNKGVLVAVIDTGIDYNHPDLAANIWTNTAEASGIPGFDDDGNGYKDDIHGYDVVGIEFGGGDGNPIDDHYHGTHVAGTIGGVGNNGAGVVGVNWNTTMAAVKFLDSGGGGSWEGAVAAIEYAVKIGAKISNNSWGGSGFSVALYDAIKAARDAGHLFVAAAGNNYSNGDASPSYPAGYSVNRVFGGVTYAGLDNIISVAATDSADNKADFSNWGLTSVHLGAPGVNTLSTMPGNSYGTLSGTSMATPHVVGAAALAWGLAGSSTYSEIKSALLSSVDPVTSLRTAGSTPVSTGGRLNAFKAVQAVGMSVAGTTPAADSVITTKPTDFVVNFSHPYVAASVDAGDLNVNGIAATSRTLTDTDTVTFHFTSSPVGAEGVQTMQMAAGAVTASGTTLPDPLLHAWTATFRYDTLRMEVVSANPPGPSAAVPLTTYVVDLNEAVNPSSVSASDLQLSLGTVTGFSLENDNTTIRFTLAGITEAYVGSSLGVSIAAGAFSDTVGNPNVAFSNTYALVLGMGVASSTPAKDETISSAPSDFVVNFTFPYDPTTVELDGSDLTVNGIAAESATLTDADTVTFHFSSPPVPASVQGVWTMQMAAGAVHALPASGLPTLAGSEWTAAFRYDATPMQIVSTNPAGPRAGVPLRTFDLNLNEEVDPTSVSAGDLYLYHDWWGDWYVNSVEVLPGDAPDTSKIRFHIPEIIDLGNLYAYVGYGAFTDEFGNPSQPFERWYELVTSMAVAGSTPADGHTIVGSARPTDFVIHFTLPYDSSSVQPGDLTVNGIAPTSHTFTDPDTVTFHYSSTPITTEGAQTMQIVAGALNADPSVGLSDPAIQGWTGTLRWDVQPLAVSSTNHVPGSQISLTGPVAYDVTFNESVDKLSVGISDLALNQGRVTSAVIDADNAAIVHYTIDGLTTEGALTVSLAAGAVTDTNGNPGLTDFSASYVLDFDSVAFPPLRANAPLGSLIYDQVAAGIIGTATDTDSFTIDVAAGQKVTVLVTPTSTLRPKVTLGSTTVPAEGSGKKALLQTVAASGPQTITVSGLDGTTGGYSIQVLLNTALETESHDGDGNNVTPQNIDDSFITVATTTVSADRGAVMGRTDSNPTVELLKSDFETAGGHNAWTIDTGTNNLWHNSIGHRAEPGHSATHSMYFGAGEKYVTKGRGSETFTKGTYEVVKKGKGGGGQTVGGTITSPAITLAPGGQISLDFNYILQTDRHPDRDNAKLQILSSTGAILKEVKYDDVAESSAWRAAATVDLSPFAGQSVQVRFNFNSMNALDNKFEGWYVDDVIVRQTTPHDNYSFTVTADQRVTVALQAAGDVNVLLQNAAGTTTLATGTSGATNLTKMISNHPLAAGTYRLAITGQTNTPYTMVVVKGAAFDAENNDTYATAQDLTGMPGVLGHVTDGTDLFSLRGTPVSGGLLLAGSKMTLGIASDGSFITGGAGIQFLGNEFVIPGTPVAGFTIGQAGSNFTNKEALGYTEIPVSMEDLSSGVFHGVRIVGTVGSGLQLERVIAFSHGDQFATIATRLTNTSGGTINNVAWLENLDPDQGEPLGYGFETFNDVVLGGQFVRADNAGGLTIGLGSADARRVVSAQGFDNRDPYEIINFPSDPNGAFEDIGINLAFNFGTLAAGQSAAGSMIMTFGQSTSEAEATYTANTGGTLVADEDWFKQTVGADGILHVETSTPGDAADQQPGNTLDPRIEVYGASSSTPVYVGGPLPGDDDDGRNEVVHVTGLVPGTVFRIRVSAEDGTGGAYFLDPPLPATGEEAPASTGATSPSVLALLASAKPKSGTGLTTAAPLGPANTAAPKPSSSATLNPASVDLAMTASPGGSSPSWLKTGSKADVDPSLLDLLSTATARGSKLGAKGRG